MQAMKQPGVLILTLILVLAAGPVAVMSCVDGACDLEFSPAGHSMPNCPMSPSRHHQMAGCCAARVFLAWDGSRPTGPLHVFESKLGLSNSAIVLSGVIAVTSRCCQHGPPIPAAQLSTSRLYVRLQTLLL